MTATSSARVLVIDDDFIHSAMTKLRLSQQGVNVRLAFSEQEAMTVARRGGFDLILSVYDGSGVDGTSIVRRLRCLAPGISRIPTVLLARVPIDAFTREALALERFPWVLSKPATLENLMEFLARGDEEPSALAPQPDVLV